MRILLGLLSAACLLVFVFFLFLHVANVVGYSSEGTDTTTRCVTPAPVPDGAITETCTGRDEQGAAISNAVYGGTSLVAGAGFAVAAALAGRPRGASTPVAPGAPAAPGAPGWHPGPGPRG